MVIIDYYNAYQPTSTDLQIRIVQYAQTWKVLHFLRLKECRANLVVSLWGKEKNSHFQDNKLLWLENKENGLLEVGGMEASTSDSIGQVGAKSGYLDGIFGCFGALRGAPGVTDGWCAPPGGCWGRMNPKDLTIDGFKGAVPLFTYEKDS